MENTVEIRLKSTEDRSYTIRFLDRYARIPAYLRNFSGISGFCLISDHTVRRLHGNRVLADLKKLGIRADILSFTPGESSKTLATAGRIADSMLRKGFDRKSCIIALGGGVVGDLAGFTAGCFMRGIPFVQIPTTLLACVDSSIGGKTGVDLLSGKNSFGLFHQPRAVLIHPAFLSTLPRKELENGLFETIKHGIIRDADYFRQTRDHLERLRNGDIRSLSLLIRGSCAIKADVVIQDERESGLRRILNFGHTVGHAIESASDFRIPHGRAVGLGMLAETRVGIRVGATQPSVLAALEDISDQMGISLKDIPPSGKLLGHMLRDKKNIRSAKSREVKIPLVLPVSLGTVVIREFKPKELLRLMQP